VPLPRPERGYSELQVNLADGLVLVTLRATGLSSSSEVAAYDAGTGERRWRTAGGVAFAGTGTRRILLHQGDEFAAVHPRTGAVAWTFRLTPGEQLHLPVPGASPADHLLLLDAGGHLTVRDLDTGAVLGTRRLPGPVAPRYAQSVGGLVLVSEPQPAGIALNAYDRRTLDPQWTVTGLPLETSVLSCPPVLCVTVSDGMLVLDPETGIQLWAGGWIQAFALGTPWPDGYLLGERFVAVGSTEMLGFVVTARTGRVVVDMRGWHPAAGVLGTPQPVVRRRIGGGRVWFGVVRPELERVEPLGTLDDAWGPCAAEGDLLACRTIDHRVRVWRMRA
jgi:outer membrane protein assembly factor BamB